MLKGVKKIVTATTLGDEYGIYRETDEKYRYLLFVCTRYNEAVERGKALAKHLKVKYENWMPTITDEQQKLEDGNGEGEVESVKEIVVQATPQAVQTKKKVMGVSKLCKQYLAEGLNDQQIVQKILPKYLEAGREEAEATVAIQNLLQYAKN